MDAFGSPSARLAEAWPLFGLRLRSERLELGLPTDDELLDLLDVARAGIHPPDDMPFAVPWSVQPSPAFEQGFLQHHWEGRAAWSPARWQLNLVVRHDGRPIGSQSIHAEDFAVHRLVDTGSWLGRAWQGRGFGREMRGAVLAFAFDGLRADRAETAAFLDNGASNAVSRSLGYAEDGYGTLAPRGIDLPTQRWVMTAHAWRARSRPAVAIEGLEACRDLFGA